MSEERKNPTHLEIPIEVYARIRVDITNAATGMKYLSNEAPEFMVGRIKAIHNLLERCSADLDARTMVVRDTEEGRGS
jgi:hypothetical protein